MFCNFVIPYRDSEYSGGKYKKVLEQFQPYFYTFLKDRSYDFNILYVEQSQDNNLFNMGKLNNIGFDIFEKHTEYVYDENDAFGHHPVDQLPSNNVVYNFNGETHFIYDQNRDAPKVHMFKNNIFKKLNGYSNAYEGWGHEDTDMLTRMRIAGINEHNSFNSFTALACNGTGITSGDGNYSPKYEEHWPILRKLEESRDIYYSGLNTLEYKLIIVNKLRDHEYHALVEI